MMSLADVRKFSPANSNTKTGYSQDKNEAAWELVNLTPFDRATRIEKFIANELQRRSGYKCHLTKPNAAWDITVELDHKPVRIEVKSSVKAREYDSYTLHNIKPELFDFLFIVLITPEGTRVAWCDSNDLQNLCRCRTAHCNGYQLNINTNKWDNILSDPEADIIPFEPDNIHEYLHDIEEFPYGRCRH